ncbi:ABATE domain-containing protein, partial [Streptomyces sp. NPDC002133]|uniref:ABATE domain-containing protein n=1 Tax=Streptomyces sp. NPDC002133 TaxID=3154409 RepID=UPI003318AEBA
MTVPAPAPALTLDLALTIRHDGHGGVADDLLENEGLTRWVREREDVLTGVLDVRGFTADAGTLAGVRDLRAAVRSLFARAVRPGPPSPADAQRLLPDDEALRRLNWRRWSSSSTRAWSPSTSASHAHWPTSAPFTA